MNTGALAAFGSAAELLDAIHELRRRGYRRLDAFTPHMVKGLEEALGMPRSKINRMIFPLAMLGAAFGFFVQWWCNAVDYPLNVGGRPPNSWPAFVPITFEAGVLTAGLTGLLLLLALTRLPRLHAPVLDVEGFDRASIDTFWVAIDDRDPMWNEVQVDRDLHEVGAIRVARARRRT